MALDERPFGRIISALAGPNSRRILQALASKEWQMPSTLAKDLGIHVSTASRYLQLMHAAGLVERRSRPHRGGAGYEYRLLRTRIVLDLVASEPVEDREVLVCLYLRFLNAVFERGRRLGHETVEDAVASRLCANGEALSDAIVRELRQVVEPAEVAEVTTRFEGFMTSVAHAYVDAVGELATRRVFAQAIEDVRADYADDVDRLGLDREWVP